MPKVATSYVEAPMGCTTTIYALPGTCPIELPSADVGLPFSDIELLGWFLDVQEHGLQKKEFYSKVGIINWLMSLLPFDEELMRCQERLWEIAPDDPTT